LGQWVIIDDDTGGSKMFKHLRKKMKVVMWFVLGAFVLWGGGNILVSRTQANMTVGAVFGKKVSYNKFIGALRAAETQAKLMYGDKYREVSKYIDLEKEAWDRIILLREAKKRKVKIADKDVIENVQQMQIFQDKNDIFSNEIYSRILQYFLRADPRIFEEQMRANMKIVKVREAITGSVELSDEELLEAYKEANERVKVNYISFSPDKFKDGIKIEDETAVLNYYNENKEDFRTKDQVSVDFIIAEKVEEPELVKEEAKEGEEQKEEAEEKQPAHEKLAEEIGEFLKENPDLEAASKKFNLPVKTTAFFSQFERVDEVGGWSFQFSQNAFDLEPEEISEAITVPNGICFISPKEKRGPHIPEFEEIKDKVEEALIQEKAKTIAKQKAQEALPKLKEALAAEDVDFKKAAETLELEAKTTESFTRVGYIPGIGESKDFADAAFTLEIGAVSEAIEGDQGVYILSPLEKEPIDEKVFKTEKEDFAKEQLEKKRTDYFVEWFEDLREQANIEVFEE